jgi:hypothetical protein
VNDAIAARHAGQARRDIAADDQRDQVADHPQMPAPRPKLVAWAYLGAGRPSTGRCRGRAGLARLGLRSRWRRRPERHPKSGGARGGDCNLAVSGGAAVARWSRP